MDVKKKIEKIINQMEVFAVLTDNFLFSFFFIMEDGKTRNGIRF